MFPTGDQTVPALGFVSSVSTAKARLHRYTPKSDRGSSSPTDGPGIRETRDHTLAPVQAPMGTSCPLLPVSDPWPSLNMVKDYNKAVIVLLFFFFIFTMLCWSLSYNSQFSSVTQSFPTFCNPMNRSTPGLPVYHQLPEFTQTHAHRVGDTIQPSHPLSSLSPPAPNPSQHPGLFQ